MREVSDLDGIPVWRQQSLAEDAHDRPVSHSQRLVRYDLSEYAQTPRTPRRIPWCIGFGFSHSPHLRVTQL